MNSLWVVNSSPVITLAKIGQLRLLDQLAETILLPDAVAAEILAGQSDDPARISVASSWAKRATAIHIPEAILEWGLGSGESSVLALALERSHATAILDDASARSAARAFSIPVMGTLGIILRAKAKGLIPSAATIVMDLQNVGLFLDDRIVRAALISVGDTLPPQN